MTQQQDQSLIQGSSEWLEMRKNFIGASDAPVILGMSPWKTPLDLWRDKVGLAPPQKETGPMLYGKQTESKAIEWFNENNPRKLAADPLFVPIVKFHPTIPYMMASLDGYCEHWDEALEIKCPGKKDHELAKVGQVPPKYIAQLQHQIEVCSLEWIWYCSFTSENQVRFRVQRDQAFIDVMLEKEAKFWDCVVNFREPISA